MDENFNINGMKIRGTTEEESRDNALNNIRSTEKFIVGAIVDGNIRISTGFMTGPEAVKILNAIVQHLKSIAMHVN